MSDMNTANYKNAQILCVGTELLLGDIVNTNAAFLSAQLAELGISVYKHIIPYATANKTLFNTVYSINLLI